MFRAKAARPVGIVISHLLLGDKDAECSIETCRDLFRIELATPVRVQRREGVLELSQPPLRRALIIADEIEYLVPGLRIRYAACV